MDKVTKERIEKLHPSVRKEMQKIVEECNQSLTGKAKIRIVQGLRTFEEQAKLYAQGRTLPGKKVTNAKEGQSIHNYGLAVDICLLIDDRDISWDTAKDWDNDKVSDWYECVKIFAKYGWNWGGNWIKFKDLPHFEKRSIISSKTEIVCDWKILSKLHKDSQGYVVI